MWVKVCGMTRRQDVEHAVAAGADAVGFVTYERSPRCVDATLIEQLAADVPILTFALTVDMAPTDAVSLLKKTGVDGIQPYGISASATCELAAEHGFRVLHPHRAEPGLAVSFRKGEIPFIDTPHATLHGGTGESFDWRWLTSVTTDFVLAGGLDAENVANAIAIARPWGVDASSGLEATPGKKDPGKVTAFVTAAKIQEASR